MKLEPATIPLATIPLATIPLATIPLATIPLATIPLATIPLWTHSEQVSFPEPEHSRAVSGPSLLFSFEDALAHESIGRVISKATSSELQARDFSYNSLRRVITWLPRTDLPSRG